MRTSYDNFENYMQNDIVQNPEAYKVDGVTLYEDPSVLESVAMRVADAYDRLKTNPLIDELSFEVLNEAQNVVHYIDEVQEYSTRAPKWYLEAIDKNTDCLRNAMYDAYKLLEKLGDTPKGLVFFNMKAATRDMKADNEVAYIFGQCGSNCIAVFRDSGSNGRFIAAIATISEASIYYVAHCANPVSYTNFVDIFGTTLTYFDSEGIHNEKILKPSYKALSKYTCNITTGAIMHEGKLKSNLGLLARNGVFSNESSSSVIVRNYVNRKDITTRVHHIIYCAGNRMNLSDLKNSVDSTGRQLTIDHINCNHQDNRFGNLQCLSSSANSSLTRIRNVINAQMLIDPVTGNKHLSGDYVIDIYAF